MGWLVVGLGGGGRWWWLDWIRGCWVLLGVLDLVVDGSFRLVVRCLPLVGHWLVVV